VNRPGCRDPTLFAHDPDSRPRHRRHVGRDQKDKSRNNPKRRNPGHRGS
jgi:hypothetical protein